EEEDVDHEPTTLIKELHNTLLEEVSGNHQYDHYDDVLVEEESSFLLLEEMGLGTYYIHKE
ncbi:hypothetical protein KI387_005648, partial [Taxus chinensis]